MGNQVTLEVINGVGVKRFNGNNCPGGGSRGRTCFGEGIKRAPLWVQAKAKQAAIKRTKEADYRRRYLGG